MKLEKPPQVCVVGQECAFELLVFKTLYEITGEGEKSEWNFFRKSEVLNEMMFGRQHLICSLCKISNHNENNQVFFFCPSQVCFFTG